MDEAIKTRDFLKEIGVEVKLDSKVAKALGHMQMPACTDCRRGQANNQEQFKKLVEEVLHPAK